MPQSALSYSDGAVNLTILKGYTVDTLDSGFVRHLRAQGLMPAQEEMDLRARGKIR